MAKKTKTDNLLEFWNIVMRPYLLATQNSINEMKLTFVKQYINIFDLSKDDSKYVFRTLYGLHHKYSHPGSEFRFESIKEKANSIFELSDDRINKGLENLIDLGLVIKKDNGKYAINPAIRTIKNRDLYKAINDIAYQ